MSMSGRGSLVIGAVLVLAACASNNAPGSAQTPTPPGSTAPAKPGTPPTIAAPVVPGNPAGAPTSPPTKGLLTGNGTAVPGASPTR